MTPARSLWSDAARLIQGPGGRAEQIDLSDYEHERPDAAATVAAWVLTCPGWSPAWDQYLLAAMHLREIDGVPSPSVRRKGASHEVMVIALNSVMGRVTADTIFAQGPPTYLLPPNVIHQIVGLTDEQAVRLIRDAAGGVVHGILVPEPQGIRGAREQWAEVLDRTAEHIRDRGHASEATT